jgi:hypothetical protein
MSERPPGSYGGDTRSPLELLLASIPCVASGCKPPSDAPLTPEEVEKVAKYLEGRSGPAASAEARRTQARSLGIQERGARWRGMAPQGVRQRASPSVARAGGEGLREELTGTRHPQGGRVVSVGDLEVSDPRTVAPSPSGTPVPPACEPARPRLDLVSDLEPSP